MKVAFALIVLVGSRLSSGGEIPPESYKDAVLADRPFAFYSLGETADAQPVVIDRDRAAGRDSEEQLKQQAPAQFEFHGFPVLPPVQGADPAIRHNEIIKFPTKLLFGRMEGALTVGVDKEGTKPVEISVGSKMIVGARDKLFVYPFGQARPKQELSGGLTSGTDLTNSATSINALLKADGGAVAGRLYVVELVVEVFETDMPPQHMWMPEGHKFKVLFSDTLKAEKIVLP